MKRVAKKNVFDDSLDDIMDEIRILKLLDHENTLRLYEYFEDKSNFYIVTDYCAGGALYDEIHSRGKFAESDAQQLVKALVSAVSHCHKNLVVHRDLKPENICFASEAKDLSAIKIIDFGTSIAATEGMVLRNQRGSVYYMAPEVLSRSYGPKCDMWSCGVITYCLLSGFPPFNGASDYQISQKVAKGEYSFDKAIWKSTSDQAKDFISKLLEMETSKRPSAEEALQHPWLQFSTEKKKRYKANPPSKKELQLRAEIKQLLRSVPAPEKRKTIKPQPVAVFKPDPIPEPEIVKDQDAQDEALSIADTVILLKMAALDNSIDDMGAIEAGEGNIQEEVEENGGDEGGQDASGRSGGPGRPLTPIAVVNHVTIDEVGECREDRYRRELVDASILEQPPLEEGLETGSAADGRIGLPALSRLTNDPAGALATNQNPGQPKRTRGFQTRLAAVGSRLQGGTSDLHNQSVTEYNTPNNARAGPCVRRRDSIFHNKSSYLCTPDVTRRASVDRNLEQQSRLYVTGGPDLSILQGGSRQTLMELGSPKKSLAASRRNNRLTGAKTPSQGNLHSNDYASQNEERLENEEDQRSHHASNPAVILPSIPAIAKMQHQVDNDSRNGGDLADGPAPGRHHPAGKPHTAAIQMRRGKLQGSHSPGKEYYNHI